jgi:hypothetical protein
VSFLPQVLRFPAYFWAAAWKPPNHRHAAAIRLPQTEPVAGAGLQNPGRPPAGSYRAGRLQFRRPSCWGVVYLEQDNIIKRFRDSDRAGAAGRDGAVGVFQMEEGL